MKRFALIGDPLGHSLSPALHKAIYRQLEIDDASYRAIELNSDKLHGFFAGFRVGGFDGINVTIPHKSSVIAMLDEVDAKAKLINAVNCINRHRNQLTGYNTDMLGFAHSLRNNAGVIENNRFVIVGAGGSALAVGAVLAEGGAKSITIVNRSEERAEYLRDTVLKLNKDVVVELANESDLHDQKGSFHCLINATSVGTSPNVSESALENVGAIVDDSTLVFDLIYNPSETKLIKDARAVGANTVNGLEMLIAQAVYSVEIWMGGNVVAHIDMNCLVKELEKLLGSKSK